MMQLPQQMHLPRYGPQGVESLHITLSEPSQVEVVVVATLIPQEIPHVLSTGRNVRKCAPDILLSSAENLVKFFVRSLPRENTSKKFKILIVSFSRTPDVLLLLFEGRIEYRLGKEEYVSRVRPTKRDDKNQRKITYSRPSSREHVNIFSGFSTPLLGDF